MRARTLLGWLLVSAAPRLAAAHGAWPYGPNLPLAPAWPVSEADRCSANTQPGLLPCYCLEAPGLVWLDGAGTVRVARDADGLQEPYRSLYRARRLDAAGQASFADPRPVESLEVGYDSSPHTQALAAARVAMRQAVAAARQELYAATEAYRVSLLHSCSLSVNTVLRAAAPQLGELEGGLAHTLAEARARALAARQRLLVTLPEQARAQGLPPALLQ